MMLVGRSGRCSARSSLGPSDGAFQVAVTAAAAVTLPRDSVGAREIRADAVHSPEIIEDAIRSPEIKKDAVGSSEIRDQSINFGDVSTGGATKLRGKLLFAEDDNDSTVPLPECDPDAADLSVCPDFLVLDLGSGGTAQPDRNWLIQAKADVDVDESNEPDNNLCGLVNTEKTGPKAVLDQVGVYGNNESDFGLPISDQPISLSAVVKKRAGNPIVALRCTREDHGPPGPDVLDFVAPVFAKIVALEMGSVTGP